MRSHTHTHTHRLYTLRRGLGNSSSRQCRSLSAISASIVTILASRALTGNCLHLSIHQHLGYSVHVTWGIGTDVTLRYHSVAGTCFARRLDTDEHCDAFCKELKRNPIDGLCDCIGSMEYMLRLLRSLNRIHRCHIYPLPSVETMSKPKWKRRCWRVMVSSDATALHHLLLGS